MTRDRKAIEHACFLRGTPSRLSNQNATISIRVGSKKRQNFLARAYSVITALLPSPINLKLRKPIRDNPKIFTKSEKMFLKSEKLFQIVMFFGNRRKRVYQI